MENIVSFELGGMDGVTQHAMTGETVSARLSPFCCPAMPEQCARCMLDKTLFDKQEATIVKNHASAAAARKNARNRRVL
jgi:hypothetical protein